MMTEKEKEVFKLALRAIEAEHSHALRAVECLANIIEDLRRYVPLEVGVSLWHRLCSLGYLERIPLYPDPEPRLGSAIFNRHRWYVRARATSPWPEYARATEELWTMLYGPAPDPEPRPEVQL